MSASPRKVAAARKDPKSAPDLRAIQRSFATGIMRPLTQDQGMQPQWIDGTATEQAAAAFIKPNDRLSSFERLEIYNRQYWFRLLDSLCEDFPGLRSLLGDERFHEMSIAYLAKYPSNSHTLRDLGDRLGQFLAQEPQWTAPHEKLASDLVRLEWAHIVAFDGEALPPLEMDALLGSGDPASLRLGLQPYLTLLACDYPVDEFLLAIRRRKEPQGEASNAVAERGPRARVKKLKVPAPQKIFLAIHRSENSVWYKRLDPEAYLIASALREGLPLQGACERALNQEKTGVDFTGKLQEWFAQWAAFGWFCRPR
jgi:hypothetical protein